MSCPFGAGLLEFSFIVQDGILGFLVQYDDADAPVDGVDRVLFIE